jgi:diketogulonate reductase-like aldo/keto reductase
LLFSGFFFQLSVAVMKAVHSPSAVAVLGSFLGFAWTAIGGGVKVPAADIGKDRDGHVVLMPMAGVGTWLYNDTQAEAEVSKALQIGVRHIDTANAYGNQQGVARGIAASGVPRSELFIVTKVPGGLSYEDTLASHAENLQQLSMDTVDLLLTHFPCTMTDPPHNCSRSARQETWRALELLYKSGKARAIGVSHYCQSHLEDILAINTVKISVNQQEWHVGMGPDPEGVVSFGKSHGILYQSFSPFCGPCGPEANKELISGDLVTSIGRAHNVSGSQVSLRWLVEQGSPVIPRSSSPEHMRVNLDLFGFSLTDEELKALNAATSPASAEPVSGDCKLSAVVV